jgi:hypothetical protein
MDLFNNLSNLLKWSKFDEFAKDKQDSDLGLDEVALDNSNALQLVDIEISRKRVKARFFALSSSLLTQ